MSINVYYITLNIFYSFKLKNFSSLVFFVFFKWWIYSFNYYMFVAVMKKTVICMSNHEIYLKYFLKKCIKEKFYSFVYFYHVIHFLFF